MPIMPAGVTNARLHKPLCTLLVLQRGKQALLEPFLACKTLPTNSFWQISWPRIENLVACFSVTCHPASIIDWVEGIPDKLRYTPPLSTCLNPKLWAINPMYNKLYLYLLNVNEQVLTYSLPAWWQVVNCFVAPSDLLCGR
jgi:hypothetical protein